MRDVFVVSAVTVLGIGFYWVTSAAVFVSFCAASPDPGELMPRSYSECWGRR